MGIITAIKSALGLGDAGRSAADTDVTVEHEPDASTERAVKSSAADVDRDSEADREDVAEASAESDETGTIEPETETIADEDDIVEQADSVAEDTGGSGSSEPVDAIKGIGSAYAERLAEAGVETVGDLAERDAAELDDATGIGESRIEGWIERARSR